MRTSRKLNGIVVQVVALLQQLLHICFQGGSHID